MCGSGVFDSTITLCIGVNLKVKQDGKDIVLPLFDFKFKELIFIYV